MAFQKASNTITLQSAEVETSSLEERTGEQVVINDFSKVKEPAIIQGEELVLHFHKIFHGVEAHAPQSKETGQALSLITQHGLESAKYIVEFARAAAEKTNFKMQHFGGVLSYASRAIADLDRHKHEQQRSQESASRQSQAIQQEQESRAKGEARLASLTPEQYQLRFDRAKAELFKQYPMLAQTYKQKSAVHEGTIRARMIREFNDEPMDLLVTPESPIGNQGGYPTGGRTSRS